MIHEHDHNPDPDSKFWEVFLEHLFYSTTNLKIFFSFKKEIPEIETITYTMLNFTKLQTLIF